MGCFRGMLAYWELVVVFALVSGVSAAYAAIWWWVVYVVIADPFVVQQFVGNWTTLLSTLGVVTGFYIGRMLASTPSGVGASARALASVHGAVHDFLHFVYHRVDASGDATTSAAMNLELVRFAKAIVVGSFGTLCANQANIYALRGSFFWAFFGGASERAPCVQDVRLENDDFEGAHARTWVPWPVVRAGGGGGAAYEFVPIDGVFRSTWPSMFAGADARGNTRNMPAGSVSLLRMAYHSAVEHLSMRYAREQPEVFRMMVDMLTIVRDVLRSVYMGRAAPPMMLHYAIDVGVLIYLSVVPALMVFMDAWMVLAYPFVVFAFSFVYVVARWIKSKQHTARPTYDTRAWTLEALAKIDAIVEEHSTMRIALATPVAAAAAAADATATADKQQHVHGGGGVAQFTVRVGDEERVRTRHSGGNVRPLFGTPGTLSNRQEASEATRLTGEQPSDDGLSSGDAGNADALHRRVTLTRVTAM